MRTRQAVFHALQRQRKPEVMPELRFQFIARRRVILSATAGNFNRTKQRSQTSSGLPIPTLLNAMQQTGTIGVPAAGWVDQRAGFGAGDNDLLPVRINGRAFAATGDDESALALCQLLYFCAGFILQ